MTIYFVDSSALVKRYAAETGSGWVRGLAAPASGNRLILTRVSVVEVTSALARRQREGSIAAADIEVALHAFRYHLNAEYQIVELDQAVADAASQLVLRHPLRAYDAVQLASALSVQGLLTQLALEPLVFLTADIRLCEIARLVGLAVDDPNQH